MGELVKDSVRGQRAYDGDNVMMILAEEIGIRTLDGYEPLLPSGKVLLDGIELIQRFTTATDNQETVTVDILAKAPTTEQPPRMLGRIVLEEIEQAACGMPRIELRIKLNCTGELKVTVRDLNSGKSTQAVCSPVSVKAA